MRDRVEFAGEVESGLTKAQEFLSLEGYTEQFRAKLGYEPFPGTLNVRLDEGGRSESRLDEFEPITIEAWEDDEQTYGAATCFPARVEANGTTVAPAHLLVPERTGHDEDVLEVIAPVELRDELDVSDGDSLGIVVLNE